MHLCCKMGWARLSQRDIFSSHMHTGPQHRTAKELVIHLGHRTSSLQFMCCDLRAQTSPTEVWAHGEQPKGWSRLGKRLTSALK